MKKKLAIILFLCFSTINSQNQKKIVDKKMVIAKKLFDNNDFRKALDTISNIEAIIGKPSKIDVLDLKINTLIQLGHIPQAKEQIKIIKQLKLIDNNIINQKIVEHTNSIQLFLNKKKNEERRKQIIEYNSFNFFHKEGEISLGNNLTQEDQKRLDAFFEYSTENHIPHCLNFVPEFDYNINNLITVKNTFSNNHSIVYIIKIDEKAPITTRISFIRNNQVGLIKNIPAGIYKIKIALGYDYEEYGKYVCKHKFKSNPIYGILKDEFIFKSNKESATLLTLDLKNIEYKKINVEAFNEKNIL